MTGNNLLVAKEYQGAGEGPFTRICNDWTSWIGQFGLAWLQTERE